jgi:hypothetical protein
VLPPWSFGLLAILLALVALPLVFFNSRFWLHLSLIIISIFQAIVFSILLFLHFYHEICSFNLNIITFFPLLFVFFPLWLGSGSTSARGAILVLTSALFPALVLIFRPWTLQHTSPFPETVLGLHLLLLAEIALWRLQNRHRKTTRATPAGDVSTHS